ncbi:MAG: hypothetical protein ACLFN8_05170 [Candidatus Woesearchaeota archaeon]
MEELFMTTGYDGLFALAAGMLVFLIIALIGIYVYTSFAFMKIGQKAKLKTPELAWIPGVGPTILAYQSSKMHWWPWLLLIAIIIPFLNILAMLTFAVFSYIWMWKLFENINKPGWWPLLGLIPGVGAIIFLIIIGLAAWGKD